VKGVIARWFAGREDADAWHLPRLLRLCGERRGEDGKGARQKRASIDY
jgi:hypothetical protein